MRAMVRSDKKSKATSTGTLGTESGIRKFTLSCSRCRASKLKCDRKEPCIECIKRDIGHLCSKDERHPRAKRAKTTNANSAKANTLASSVEIEDTVQALDDFFEETSGSVFAPTRVSRPTTPSVAPDYANVYWQYSNGPLRENEKVILIQEIAEALPERDMIQTLHQIFVTRCQGPLGNIFHTPTFLQQAERFYDCLLFVSNKETASILSSSIALDDLACYLLALVLGLAFHPGPSIFGWSSTPVSLRVEKLRATNTAAATWRTLALRCLQGRMSIFSGSIASLQAAVMLLVDGREGPLELDSVLVTAISGAQKLGLHRLGDAKLEIPTSAIPNAGPPPTVPTHIRTELGVRIWWALVARDWSRGQALGYYTIQPSLFNTRMPLHVNDEDLCMANSSDSTHISERPRSEFTMLSYTIYALEVAGLVRESIDLRNALCNRPQKAAYEATKAIGVLNQKYAKFVVELPTHFRLGSTAGLTSTGFLAAIPVQQWMLHQQLWSLFLRVHRANLSSTDGRTSCQLLAQNIISSHAQVQARCSVCGSLSIGDAQLFNAAAVLAVGLIFESKSDGAESSGSQLTRMMTRDKIREAMELLRARNDISGSQLTLHHQDQEVKGSNQRVLDVLETLMKLEENCKDLEIDGPDNMAETPESHGNLLKRKVLNILQELSEYSVSTSEEPTSNLPDSLGMSPFTNLFPGDLDVLPVLSNDPACNFWQSMDFPSAQTLSSDGLLFEATDWQTLTPSMPFTPPSDMRLTMDELDGMACAETSDTNR